MSQSIKKSLIALTVSSALIAPSAFATNGYFAHGYSTAEKGLAGAGVAHSQDALAVANNPAGIAGMGERMDVGAAIFSPKRSYTVTGAPSGQPNTFPLAPGKVDSNLDYFLIPHFAYNWKLDSDSSTAVAVYGNGGMNSNYKAPAPGTFGNGTTGVDLKQLFVNWSYATKLNQNHSFGASLIFAYQTFESKGLANFGGFSTAPTKLSGNGPDSSTGFGVKLGWQGKVSSAVTLGASYQSKMSMSEFDDYAGLFAEKGDFDIPATATIGLAWKTSDKSTLVFDIQSIYYSDVKSLNNSVARLQTACNLTDQSGCLGAANGGGFGWDDMTIYKLGYEWGDTTTWRVGISNGSQPIPNSEVMFNILAPAVVETAITGGFTMPLSSSSEFAFAAMYAPSNSVTGPNPFELPGQQTIKIEMYQIELQATYSMMF
jgi:long-chain fatty acid transport protein